MTPTRKVMFVCLHGAAKSVLAAADFKRLAAARGLEVRTDAAGIEPDPEIAPRVAQALLAEGIDLRGQRPRRLTRDDLAGAWRVVAFGCDLRQAVDPAAVEGLAVERWDDVPAVSDDLDAARAAIGIHLRRLLDECPGAGVAS